MRRVFIYGAGMYGKALKALFEEINVPVEGFIESQKEKDSICGVPVYSYSDISNDLCGCMVFIAIQSQTISKIIRIKLQSQGKDITILDGVSLVEDNLFSIKETGNAGKKCIACKNTVGFFLPGGINNNLFKRHHILGGGYRRNCECPYCGTIDRTRWVLYVLQRYTNISKLKNGRVLHFAPELAISRYILNHTELEYYSGDIVPGKAMFKTDITNIEQYAKNTFDYVICNHVLEHIVDIEVAVKEIKRVLKDDGRFIFSFPICTDMLTYEDKTITTDEERLNRYGQEDHVRLYGTDYIEIYKSYGFDIDVYSPEKCVDKDIINSYGFIPDDVVMIGTKSIKDK